MPLGQLNTKHQKMQLEPTVSSCLTGRGFHDTARLILHMPKASIVRQEVTRSRNHLTRSLQGDRSIVLNSNSLHICLSPLSYDNHLVNLASSVLKRKYDTESRSKPRAWTTRTTSSLPPLGQGVPAIPKQRIRRGGSDKPVFVRFIREESPSSLQPTHHDSWRTMEHFKGEKESH